MFQHPRGTTFDPATTVEVAAAAAGVADAAVHRKIPTVPAVTSPRASLMDRPAAPTESDALIVEVMRDPFPLGGGPSAAPPPPTTILGVAGHFAIRENPEPRAKFEVEPPGSLPLGISRR